MNSGKFRVSKKLLFLFLLSFIVNITHAGTYNTSYNNLNYTVDTETNTATCTGLASGVIAEGDLIIPDYIDYEGVQYPVTEIRFFAFFGCSGFTGSLTIGNSVSTIGDDAFSGCSGFTGTLTIGNSVSTIGDYAFSGCNSFTGSLTIPNSVTKIGMCAFSGCSGFTGTLTIGSSVSTIGDYAFSECNSFTGSLTIGNSVTTIGYMAFYGCSGFNGTLTIPDSVTVIGSDAFSGCSGFTGSLTIPDSVTAIGPGAFSGCSGFTGSLTIGNSVTTIGYTAFYGCSGFTGSLTIGNSVTEIGEYAFSECNSFTGSLTIGNSVTEIGYSAFLHCSGFNGTLSIGNSVTTIGDLAFYSLNFTEVFSYNLNPPTASQDSFTNLTKSPLYVPKESIGAYKIAEGWKKFKDIYVIAEESVEGLDFLYDGIWYTIISVEEKTVKTRENGYRYGHQDLTDDLIIPSTVPYYGEYYTVVAIGEYSFRECTNLTGVLILPETLKNIGVGAFWNCSGFSGSLTIPDSVTEIGYNAFLDCPGFTGSLTIPGSVTAIGSNAFLGCSGFTGSLFIPESLTKIDSSVFSGCSGFTGSLTIPESVTEIGSSAFQNCSGFTGLLTIGNSVTTIGNSAFSGCSGLTGSLTIPESVTEIGYYAFSGCSGFTGSLVIGNSVTTIGNRSFQNCSGFTGSLTIPESVTEIGGRAFLGCSGFTGSLTIGNSVTTIGEDAFYECFGFTGSLTIGNSVTKIETYVFYNCSGFTGSLTIPDSVIEIGSMAFLGCSGLTDTLIIGNSVNEIGVYAFSSTNFTEVYSYNPEPAEVGEYAFSSIMSSPLYVPAESINSYKEAEGWKEFNRIYPIGGAPVEGLDFEYDGIWYTIISAEDQTVRTKEDGAWAGTKELNGSLIIPSSVEYAGYEFTVIEIGNRSFANNLDIVGELVLPETLIYIGDHAFIECQGLTGDIRIPNSVERIGPYAFFACRGFTGDLIIGNSVTIIDRDAFNDCHNMVGSLILGSSLIKVDESAFSECHRVTGSLILPETLEEIGFRAFNNCYELTGSLIIPNSVRKIDHEAFRNCYGLNESLTIGSSVSEMEWGVFDGVDFKEVICLPLMPPTLERSIFSDETYRNAPLYVPEGSVNRYKDANYWKDFNKIRGLDQYGNVKVESIELSASAIEILLGEVHQLKATVYPDDVTDPTVTWISSNPAVATVSADGMVRAVAVGAARVTATCGEVSASCEVTVSPVMASSVTLNVRDITLLLGQTNQLRATVSPDNTTDKTVTWSSDNSEVATVNADGTVTAVSVGTATITASCGEISATCRVTVNPVPVEGVVLNVSDMTLLLGETARLTVRILPENTTDQTVTWRSENPMIATVGTDGTVTGVSVGTTVITATVGELSASCVVTVNPISSSEIILNIRSLTLRIGETETLTATVVPENTTDKTVTWSSDNPAVATVSSNGTVTAISTGAANIIATCGDITATCRVLVNPVPVTGLNLNIRDMGLLLGHTDKLIATVMPENATDKTVTWSSDNPVIATVDDEGNVTAVSVGTTNIIATCGEITAVCHVTVNPIPSSGLALNLQEMTLLLGHTNKLIATIQPENTTDQSVTWSSDNTAIATVGTDGTVTGVSVGTAIITATNGEYSATCTVIVISPELISISLSPLTMTLDQGTSGQFKVALNPTTALAALTWSVGDNTIAEVNQEGTVIAKNPGMTTVTVRSDNQVYSMGTVKVVDNNVSSITISPYNFTLEIGQNTQLKAKITPEGALTAIKWSSGDESVVTVDDNGFVTAVGPGATIIYATSDNGVKGMATVVVVTGGDINSVIVSPENLEMVIGSEAQLEVVLNSSVESSEVTWLSADNNVAEVSETGLVRAISPGATVIYAVAENGMTGFAAVKVVSNEVTSIVINPDDVTLALDGTVELSALVEPIGVAAVLTWSSTDTSVATVDNHGVVKALEPGYTFIYATAENGVTGLSVVKVIDPDSGGDNPGQGYGEDGVYISTLRIREGDLLGLFADRPVGYENNDWTYEWYLDGELEAEGKYVLVTAGKDSEWWGTVKEITPENYQVEIYNTIGDEISHDLPEVSVYARPLTPIELIRKGDGDSNSFIAISQFSDSDLARMGYSFVFGYTDGEGVNHVLSNSELRYCHTTKDIYNNSTFRFWVYTSWVYPDGAVITSGLRYLDGSVNENFDRSDFNYNGRGNVSTLEAESQINIYTMEGHMLGSDLSKLAPGIYIVRERKGNVVISRKIIKR
ncbi:MAG: leucine-rich repeat protein [Muribaculaceae bacterium]|nr:leucine-rich repeat protein [Muribaculaceae bacterium]